MSAKLKVLGREASIDSGKWRVTDSHYLESQLDNLERHLDHLEPIASIVPDADHARALRMAEWLSGKVLSEPKMPPKSDLEVH